MPTHKEFMANEMKKRRRAGATPQEAMREAAKAWNRQTLARSRYRPERTQGVSIVRVRKEKLMTRGGYAVWLVDGQRVRDKVHIDFVAGGNPGRYGYVPKGEVWVEEHYTPMDILATAVHEIFEAKTMKEKGKTYEQAHGMACRLEKKVRRGEKPRTKGDVVKGVKRWV